MKLFRKREVWLPTGSGVLLLAVLLAALFGWGASRLYPLLSLNRPYPDVSLIIIEGWIPDEELASIRLLLRPGQKIVTTGGPVQFGGSLLKEKTYAEVTASRLRIAGENPDSIICAPAPLVVADRTYAAALAARRALEEQGLFGEPCNLYSLGAHARRSFTLYRAAFGKDYPLGVVSLESREYDLERWWTSSLAFKHMLSELASWVYVKCTFWKYGGEGSGLGEESSGWRTANR